jgi:hypothetical protein
MKRQVIQKFLNLPGISGIALMDGRTRPFFCGLDTILNTQQKEALAQGIQQVVDTTPADFDAFSFRFNHRQAHIYRLKEGVILLVLASEHLPFNSYLEDLYQLRSNLEEDINNAVANFRLGAGATTLSKQSYWSTADSPENLTSQAGFSRPEQHHPNSHAPNWEDVLAAMNHLSDFTTQYLGKIVVANNWRSARPQEDWLGQFEVNRAGHIAFLEGANPSIREVPTEEQLQGIQQWTKAFVARCSNIIRDFPKILAEQALDDAQRKLLLPKDK